MFKDLTTYEAQRLLLQSQFELTKTQSERNRLGQFATPTELAGDILRYARKMMSTNAKIRFLDPAFGTGSFYSALLQEFNRTNIVLAQGYEIDSTLYDHANKVWIDTNLRLLNEDFTLAQPPEDDREKVNLLICNPPYVRHHHFSKKEKDRLAGMVKLITGRQLSGLSGLYCYFLCLSHVWMQEDGVAGWLIPSEFMDVNYGREIKEYLTHDVTLLHIHRFDPNEVQFSDALVSSAIVWFKKAPPVENHTVKFSFGGTLEQPAISVHIPISDLRKKNKWSSLTEKLAVVPSKNAISLSNLFTIKRGIATGANKYFILSENELTEKILPQQLFIPILPSARYLETDEILSDDNGKPLVEKRYFLLKCDLPEEIIRESYPTLWAYLEEGMKEGVQKTYICSHRNPWYSQEERSPTEFLCTYIGRQSNGARKNPFRFILNHSNAICTNVYLMMYPKSALARALKNDPSLARQIWTALKNITPETLMKGGRVYGGGMYKLEPKELLDIPVDLPPNIIALFQNPQQELSFE